MDEIILTDNGKVALAYMQENDQVHVGKDLIELTGIKGIYPVLNSLIRNGLVVQAEPLSRNFTNNKGETQLKEYKIKIDKQNIEYKGTIEGGADILGEEINEYIQSSHKALLWYQQK